MKFKKYLNEKVKFIVQVFDEKGNRITTMSSEDFMKSVKPLGNFKFLQDAIELYNKKYPKNTATLKIEK